MHFVNLCCFIPIFFSSLLYFWCLGIFVWQPNVSCLSIMQVGRSPLLYCLICSLFHGWMNKFTMSRYSHVYLGICREFQCVFWVKMFSFILHISLFYAFSFVINNLINNNNLIIINFINYYESFNALIQQWCGRSSFHLDLLNVRVCCVYYFKLFNILSCHI